MYSHSYEKGVSMKIQLDTESKTIKIESDVKLEKLITTLNKLLPHGEWKNFTLQTNTVIHQWNSPIIIKEFPNYLPWYRQSGEVLCNTNSYKASWDRRNTQNNQLLSGTYNINA